MLVSNRGKFRLHVPELTEFGALFPLVQRNYVFRFGRTAGRLVGFASGKIDAVVNVAAVEAFYKASS